MNKEQWEANKKLPKSPFFAIQVCLVCRKQGTLYNITTTKPKLQVCKEHYNQEAAEQYKLFLKEHSNDLYVNRHHTLPAVVNDHPTIVPDTPAVTEV